MELGEYRGFPMTLWVSDSGLSPKLQITLKHTRSHTFEPGSDPFGNITRMDNVLEGMRDNLEQHQTVLGNLLQQMEDAKVEVKRPFPQEAELAEKSERLAALNVALNIGFRSPMTIIASQRAASSCASDCRTYVALHIVSKISAFVHSFFTFSLLASQIFCVEVVWDTNASALLRRSGHSSSQPPRASASSSTTGERHHPAIATTSGWVGTPMMTGCLPLSSARSTRR